MTNLSSSDNWPKISIVTPSFNQGNFIEATIRSVLSQGYPNLEYLVMDGGSTDQTVEILKKYNGQLSWVSEKDRGQSHAINKGFNLATGDIFSYINSDDVYEPGGLHRVGAFFASHPQAHWLTGRCRIINSQGNEIRKLITAYKNFWLLSKSYQVLSVIDYISQPATFWRREVIRRIGSFNEELHLAMDYDYSLRVGKQYRLWVVNDYLASFRVHSGSKSALIRDHFNEDLAVARKYVQSKLLINLHRFHNQLIIFSYLQSNK
jgi:glycosyltransferase involved in cell wall biosynthesis